MRGKNANEATSAIDTAVNPWRDVWAAVAQQIVKLEMKRSNMLQKSFFLPILLNIGEHWSLFSSFY